MDQRNRAAVIPSGAGEHIVMSEIRVDELEGFPIGLWVNFSEENKFVTGLNEIIFMLQPMDILDYIDEHAPNEKEEILNSIREGLREIKEARRTGRKLMTAEELLNEL